MSSSRALVAEAEGDDIVATIRDREIPAASHGEALIRVEASSLNYKDALALTPGNKVIRSYPIVPGIDLAGVVVSDGGEFPRGTRVLAHGYDLGVSRDGGYAEHATVPESWLVALPDGLSAADAMGIGTAGFTAALSVQTLLDHGVRPSSGPVLVTGASGGVGSIAADILVGLGFRVHASTGNAEIGKTLLRIGVEEVLPRFEVPERIRPLGSARWVAVVDSVGGPQLALILSEVAYGGVVAASGLTGGTDIPTTVMPFILRGVTLAGIDSVQLGIERRREIWRQLGSQLTPTHLGDLTRTVALADVPALAADMMRDGVGGRVVVSIGS